MAEKEFLWYNNCKLKFAAHNFGEKEMEKKLTKSVRLGLRPVGQTEEWMRKDENLCRERELSKARKDAESILKKIHAQFVENVLEKLEESNLPFEKMVSEAERYLRKQMSEDEVYAYFERRFDFCKKVVEKVTGIVGYSEINTPYLFREKYNREYDLTEEERATLSLFDGQGQYFGKFFGGRKQMYEGVYSSGSISYILMDNMETYALNNIMLLEQERKKVPPYRKCIGGASIRRYNDCLKTCSAANLVPLKNQLFGETVNKGLGREELLDSIYLEFRDFDALLSAIKQEKLQERIAESCADSYGERCLARAGFKKIQKNGCVRECFGIAAVEWIEKKIDERMEKLGVSSMPRANARKPGEPVSQWKTAIREAKRFCNFCSWFLEDVNGRNAKRIGQRMYAFELRINAVSDTDVQRTERYRYFFGYPQFGGGWSSAITDVNGLLLLRKDNAFYIGIPNRAYALEFCGAGCAKERVEKDVEYFEKMDYSVLKYSARMIPKCTFRRKDACRAFQGGAKEFVMSSDGLLEPISIPRIVYENSLTEYGMPKYARRYLEKTGDAEGYAKAVREMIEFSYRFLRTYRSTAGYDYTPVLPLSKYQSTEEFFQAVDDCSYHLSMDRYVSAEYINRSVATGRLYLFRVCNRDLQPGISGKQSPYAKRFLSVFQNCCRLSGGAEFFFYPGCDSSKAVRHAKGSVLLNRKTRDGKTIPGDVYSRLLAYFNGRQALADGDSDYVAACVTKTSAKDVVKDSRIYSDRYELVVPVTVTAAFDGSCATCREQAIEELRKQNALSEGPKRPVLVIVKGTRGHLLYFGLFRDGEKDSEKQRVKELRVVGNIDFGDVLSSVIGKEGRFGTPEARRVLSGYNAVAVKFFSDLAVKENAFVVLEKKYRKFFENAVYDDYAYADFGDRLKERLECVVEDNGCRWFTDNGRKLFDGGVLQVSNSFTRSVGLDGFWNIFDFGKYGDEESIREFFNSFREIRYSGKRKEFFFVFSFAELGYGKEFTRVFKLASDTLSEQMAETLNAASVSVGDGNILEGIVNCRVPQFFFRMLAIFRLLVNRVESDEVCGDVLYAELSGEKKSVSEVAAVHLYRKARLVFQKIASSGGSVSDKLSSVSDAEWMRYNLSSE